MSFFSGWLHWPEGLNKDPTVWLVELYMPTSISHPPSWGMCPCSCVAYPPQKYIWKEKNRKI